MFSSTVARGFALRHRQKVLEAIRHSVRLLLFAGLVLASTVVPTFLLWWDTVMPAAIGIAIVALVLFSILMMLPLEFIAYVDLYFDQRLDGLPHFGLRSGRRLYRESGRLDGLAREAGLPPLSDFESPDVLDTREAPIWHRPETALPTLEHLLARVDSRQAVHRDLQHVHTALRLATERGARFYLLLHTMSGMTNAEIQARRRGEVL
jgi:hypothetical protein